MYQKVINGIEKNKGGKRDQKCWGWCPEKVTCAAIERWQAEGAMQVPGKMAQAEEGCEGTFEGFTGVCIPGAEEAVVQEEMWQPIDT